MFESEVFVLHFALSYDRLLATRMWELTERENLFVVVYALSIKLGLGQKTRHDDAAHCHTLLLGVLL